jgi:hypothetical protein
MRASLKARLPERTPTEHSLNFTNDASALVGALTREKNQSRIDAETRPAGVRKKTDVKTGTGNRRR